MSNKESKIKILPPEEARKIAAGEVVEKPAALVREFLDNAIDAGGRLIEVIIDEGGIRRTEVVDNGGGMGKEDLELCCLAHATSKIRALDDLKTATTLGFRGEALAAAAAVSRLEILSSPDGKEAWKLSAGPGVESSLEQSRRAKGTTVRALGLYDTIPARKRFLKRSGSEAAACRQIFNEKALAFPHLAFRFTQDENLKCFLPPVSSFRERFSQIFLEGGQGLFLHEIAANGSGFTVTVVAGGPELSRNDRRLQFVFANSRRIQDFALLQALEYGLQGWFPNGTHPLGAVFVSIDPALADFNIHPAKREARFADPGAIHHAVSSALRDFCRAASLQGISHKAHEDTEGKISHKDTEGISEIFSCSYGPKVDVLEPKVEAQKKEIGNRVQGTENREQILFGHQSPKRVTSLRSDTVSELTIEALQTSATAEKAVPYLADGIRYLGRLFGLFILVEKDEKLYIIDQHAAHERILYERFTRGPIPRQELLVAIPFTTESPEDDSFLEGKREELARLGVVIKKEKNEWLIEALPAAWKLSDRETIAEILNLKIAKESMAEHWAATLACRSAVMDGDFLDEKTALALAEEAFALPVRLCPHGRPIWFEISRQDLLKAVKRE